MFRQFFDNFFHKINNFCHRRRCRSGGLRSSSSASATSVDGAIAVAALAATKIQKTCGVRRQAVGENLGRCRKFRPSAKILGVCKILGHWCKFRSPAKISATGENLSKICIFISLEIAVSRSLPGLRVDASTRNPGSDLLTAISNEINMQILLRFSPVAEIFAGDRNLHQWPRILQTPKIFADGRNFRQRPRFSPTA